MTTEHFGEWLTLQEERDYIREEAELLRTRLRRLRTRDNQLAEAQALLSTEEKAAGGLRIAA